MTSDAGAMAELRAVAAGTPLQTYFRARQQILRFFDAKRQLLAEMAPPDARFGWPKRNGFVQPKELLGAKQSLTSKYLKW